MNGPDYVEDSCAEFYPATPASESVRTANKAVVTLQQMNVMSQHVVRRVLRHARHDKDHSPYTVTQLQFRSWKMYDQVQYAYTMYAIYTIELRYCRISRHRADLCVVVSMELMSETA